MNIRSTTRRKFSAGRDEGQGIRAAGQPGRPAHDSPPFSPNLGCSSPSRSAPVDRYRRCMATRQITPTRRNNTDRGTRSFVSPSRTSNGNSVSSGNDRIVSPVCQICTDGACHVCEERFDTGDHGQGRKRGPESHSFAWTHTDVIANPEPTEPPALPWLTPAELAELINQAPHGPARAAVLLQAHAGLRVSEVSALKWSAMKQSRELAIDGRIVPIGDVLGDVLGELRYWTRPEPHARMFSASRVTLWRWAQAGMNNQGRLKTHTLRLTAGSRWMQAGEPPAAVIRLLGLTRLPRELKTLIA